MWLTMRKSASTEATSRSIAVIDYSCNRKVVMMTSSKATIGRMMDSAVVENGAEW